MVQKREEEAKKTNPLTASLKPPENKPYQTNNAIDIENTINVTEDISMLWHEHEDSDQDVPKLRDAQRVCVRSRNILATGSWRSFTATQNSNWNFLHISAFAERRGSNASV